jgi:hypothetical protein
MNAVDQLLADTRHVDASGRRDWHEVTSHSRTPWARRTPHAGQFALRSVEACGGD